MTVAELIAELQKMPPDAPVVFPFREDWDEVSEASAMPAVQCRDGSVTWWSAVAVDRPDNRPGATVVAALN